jgi:hypothetical protein
MKWCLLIPFAAVASLMSCSTIQGPISEGDYDPLTAPGALRKPADGLDGSSGFAPGQFVRTSMDNASFFNKRPRGDADADKMLKMSTQMKVVEVDGVYLKVELDSGEVGYVPAVMVEDPSAVLSATPGSGEIPIVPGIGPLTPVDQTLPVIPPGEGPPVEGIPTVIDPASPNEVPIPPPADAKPSESVPTESSTDPN